MLIEKGKTQLKIKYEEGMMLEGINQKQQTIDSSKEMRQKRWHIFLFKTEKLVTIDVK